MPTSCDLKKQNVIIDRMGMFLEASVSHSVHEEDSMHHRSHDKGGLHPEGVLIMTSNGSHCSGRYASYWNAFLLGVDSSLSVLKFKSNLSK